jgi:hypothetical protein
MVLNCIECFGWVLGTLVLLVYAEEFVLLNLIAKKLFILLNFKPAISIVLGSY